jgi:hypothetical protein
MKRMRTELISRDISDSPGYGSGEGDIERLEYKCPCGAGRVIEEHDNIPGFRDHTVYLSCKICNVKYELDTTKGTRSWELKVKQSFDTIKLDLYDNAVDSFVVAIDSFIKGDNYPKYYKIAIKEMFSAFELMLKDILSHEHPSLIYSKVEDFAEPIHKRHSVNYDTLVSRLEKLADFKIDENYNRIINKLRSLRNLGMHSTFEVNRFNAADNISKAVPIFVNLHRRFYEKKVKLSDLLGEESFKDYLKQQMAMTALINDAKKRFEKDNRKKIELNGVVVKCNICNSELIVHEDSKIKCYCCHEEFNDFFFYSTFIKFDDELSDNEIYECPRCNCHSLALYEPHGYHLCLSCGEIVARVTCEDCIREFPLSEVEETTDYSGDTTPDAITYICYECKHPYDEFD